MAARVFTEEQLRAAWQARRRSNWPETFEEAMNDRCFSGLVRIEARLNDNRSKTAQAVRRPTSNPLIPIPQTPIVMDAKRRAAGERDDDDSETT